MCTYTAKEMQSVAWKEEISIKIWQLDAPTISYAVTDFTWPHLQNMLPEPRPIDFHIS